MGIYIHFDECVDACHFLPRVGYRIVLEFVGDGIMQRGSRLALVTIMETVTQRRVWQGVFPLDVGLGNTQGVALPATANTAEASDRPYQIHVMELGGNVEF